MVHFKINNTSMVYHSNYLPSGNQYYKRTKERKTIDHQNSTTKNTMPSRLSPDTSLTQTDQSAMTTKHFEKVLGFDSAAEAHGLICPCLMMGEVSLETSPKTT